MLLAGASRGIGADAIAPTANLAEPLDRMTGRVVYSQRLLIEAGVRDSGAGLGVDPEVPVSGFSRT